VSALGLHVARRLEQGDRRVFMGGALSRLWIRTAGNAICRPLVLPRGVPVVGVGGATLGGSGKTPFAIALARSVARAGGRVALIGHAFRASPRCCRVVSPSDDVRDVGDDALVAARSLETCGVPVIVAPTRQAALDFAASRADVLVVDGLLQARPHRLARSILVVDGDQPWGSGNTPPLGDLRAPRELLLRAADAVVVVTETAENSCLGAFSHPPRIAKATLSGARAPGGSLVLFDQLGREPFGLLLGIARPDRVVRALGRRGLHARISVRFGDHVLPAPGELERAGRAARAGSLRAWLCTAKCAPRLPAAVGGVPVLVLDHQVEVPVEEVDLARTCFPGPSW
jgi:tetraacyldisaccharide 4'-kinase